MMHAAAVRVVLPYHLRNLAGVEGEVELAVAVPVTTGAILDALEDCFPVLRGTIRDHDSGQRRPRVRFFADEQDVTHDPSDRPLPPVIAAGGQPFMIVGAISGG